MSSCKFLRKDGELCGNRSRDDYCSIHKYKTKNNKCQFMEDGKLCLESCENKICEKHKYKKSNKCSYVGVRIGLCGRPCTKNFCSMHTEKTLAIKKETNRKRYLSTKQVKVNNNESN